MDWLDRAFFGDEAEPAAKPAEPPRQALKVESCWVVVCQPSREGDLGETVACHYFVEDGSVTLCDQRGKSTGIERRLARDDDPRAIARRLRREAWNRESGRSAFDRPLRYGPSGLP